MDHKWKWFERWGFDACETCGIVKGLYPKKPCKGPMRLRPMERSEPVTSPARSHGTNVQAEEELKP